MREKDNMCMNVMWTIVGLAVFASVPVVVTLKAARGIGEAVIFIADCFIHPNDMF